MDMSLDQIIKTEKANKKQSRAHKRSTPIKSPSNRRDSGVKFTARLDIDKVKSKKPRSPKKIVTTPPPTSPATPPPLKITIQNNAKSVKRSTSPINISRREERDHRPSLDRIKVSKSVAPKRLSLSLRRGGRRESREHYSNNSNNNSNNYESRRQSSFGDGPSLFERKSHSSHRGNQPSGKNLQLFTGSRLNLANLHHAITLNDLRLLFEKMGEIKTIKINYDKAGRSEGTGFVVFSKDSDAKAAQDRYNGAKLDGLSLQITKGHSLQDDIRDLY